VLDIALGILFFLIFLLIVIKSPFFSSQYVSKRIILLSYAFRILACILFYVVYTYYYTDRAEADMYRYFDDGKIMYSALSEQPLAYVKMLTGIGDKSQAISDNYYMAMNTWYKSFDNVVPNDNRTMVRLNAFLMLFTFGSFYANAMIFMFLAFTGLLMIYKTIAPENSHQNKISFFLFIFFPSLVFWTSNISKEALVIFALGGFLLTLKKLVSQPFQFQRLLLPFVFLLLLFSVKIYVLLCLIPMLIAYFWCILKPGRSILKFSAVFTAYVVLLWNFSLLFPDFDLVEAFVRQQINFMNFASDINAGSILYVPVLEANFFSFVKAAPVALANVLFRPFFFDSYNVFMFFVSIENMLFMIFLIVMLFHLKKNLMSSPLFLACIGFSLFFFIVVGLATPVMGAIVRYKIIGYPFLFAALISITDENKLNAFLKFKTKKNE
jgi:hypothetical protein